jgi:hypothetical protein
MRKWITFLMTFLVGSCASYVSANNSSLAFEAGYRHDTISWTAEAPADNPFISTTSKFKDINIFQIGVRGRSNLGCNFFVRGSAHWGWIIDGDHEESTEIFFSDLFPFDNIDTITFEEETDNVLDGRFTVDLDIAVGYPFYFCDCTMTLAPVIGYSFNEQNLCVEENERIIFVEDPITGAVFPVLDDDCCCNKLISRWWGPFIGLDFEYLPADSCWNFYASLEYHFARFKGKRHAASGFDAFDDFDRTARHGHGWVLSIGAEYDFCNCWTAGIDLDWKDFRAHKHHHHDETSFSDFFDESLEDLFETKHDWRSFAISVFVGKHF